MPKTFTAIITECNSLADDTFDNADWATWINGAISDLSDFIYLETNTTITQTNGAFTLPTNVKSIIMVNSSSVNDIKPADITDYTTQSVYKVFNGLLYLQGIDDTSIDLYYYRYPTEVSTGDAGANVDVPDSFLEAIMLYAVARAMEKDDEPERAEMFTNDYFRIKQMLEKTSHKRRAKRIGQWGVYR